MLWAIKPLTIALCRLFPPLIKAINALIKGPLYNNQDLLIFSTTVLGLILFFSNRAKQALGSCVRVAAHPRDVFNRVLLLFTMNVIPDDEDATNNGQAQQL